MRRARLPSHPGKRLIGALSLMSAIKVMANGVPAARRSFQPKGCVGAEARAKVGREVAPRPDGAAPTTRRAMPDRLRAFLGASSPCAAAAAVMYDDWRCAGPH